MVKTFKKIISQVGKGWSKTNLKKNYGLQKKLA